MLERNQPISLFKTIMKIEILNKNQFMIGCDDRLLLKRMQGMMHGKKIRGYNRIIIPLKSGPKIYRFRKYGIQWGNGAQKLVNSILENIKKRKDVIDKIKSQYGREIKFDYDYQGIYDVMEHQKILFNMMAYPEAASIISDTGTCKTGPYLWAIDQRIKRGQVKKALVITMTDLKKNVLAEMKIQVPHLTGVVLKNKTQSSNVINKTYKIKDKNVDYDIYIGNYESMFSILSITPDGYFDMVILDEAHRVGSPGSRQTKKIVKKFEYCKYKFILTATLTSNNLMSFFMPFRFLGPDTVPYAKYGEFRGQYMHSVDEDGHVWVPNGGAEEVVARLIGNMSVAFKKEDCLDLPPLIHEVITCDMTPDQARLYNSMKKDCVAIIDDMCNLCSKKGKCDMSCEQTMTAQNALVLTTKLQQIASGFYINTRTTMSSDGKEIKDKSVITLEENPKLRLLIQVLNNIPSDRKVIIWAHYTHAIDLIKRAVGNAFGEDRYLTGYLKQDAYEQVQKFKDPQYRFLIGNQKKMGHGHNIQFSNYQVFFCNPYSYIQRDQAEGRQYRKGQELSVTAIDLATRFTIDEVVLKALANKVDLILTLEQWARVLKKGPDALEI